MRALILTLSSALVLAGCGGSPETSAESPADTIRVLAYNIHHGEGMDSVLDLTRLADLIASTDPDLVAVQEVDSVVDRTEDVDQAAELGRLTGLEHHFGSFMPYQGGAYGMAVLSRLPVVRTQNLRLPDGDEPRTSLAVTVELPRSGMRLRFVGVHFYRTDQERMAQALSLEEQLGSETVPTILAGDFNSRPGSQVMEHLASGWSLVEKGPDSFTFPSYAPDHEIDFVLMRPAGSFEVLSERVLDEPVASDHRPVLVELVVRHEDEAPRTASGPIEVPPSDVHPLATVDSLAVVQDLELLSDGSVWVQNSLPPFFVGFDPEGEVVAMHGAEGGGPEEFQLPAGFVTGGLNGEAWIFDLRRHTLIQVSRPDEPWSEIRLPRGPLPPGTVQGGMGFLSNLVRTARLGSEIVLPHSTGTLRTGIFSMVEGIIKADLLAFDPSAGEAERMLDLGAALDDPFENFEPTEGGFPLWKRLWASCGDHLRVFDQVRNQLRGFDREGTELEPIQLGVPPLTEVSPRDFALSVFPLRQAEVTGGVGMRLPPEDSVRLIDRMSREAKGTPAQLAAYLPAVVDFRCSPAGTMWIQPLDPAGGGLAGGRRWVRIGTDGVSQDVLLPERFDALRFTETRVWGVQRDEFDVPVVAWAALPRN